MVGSAADEVVVESVKVEVWPCFPEVVVEMTSEVCVGVAKVVVVDRAVLVLLKFGIPPPPDMAARALTSAEMLLRFLPYSQNIVPALQPSLPA